MSIKLLACISVLLLPLTAFAADTLRIGSEASLQQIRIQHPAHYLKIIRILDDIQEQPDYKLAQWMQANYQASDLICHPLLMNSDPPKRKLSFSLDEQRYAGIITLNKLKVELVPARQPSLPLWPVAVRHSPRSCGFFGVGY
jgi:hypothetical protein